MAAVAVLSPSLTPSPYFQIVSPTLTLPSDPQTPMPVGLLACQRDPLLRELDTHVISATVHHPPPAPAGKKTKKAVIAPELPKGLVLEVVLHDTVIFPEGGGQPTDTGFIQIGDVAWQVAQCKRHGGHAVHYVAVPDGKLDEALLAFASGAAVRVSVHFERRYDLMSMHTSQHLLSALLDKLGLPTLSWSLTTYPAPCYVEVPRGVTAVEVAAIQKEANRLVFAGKRVHIEVRELDDAPPANTEAASRTSAKGLPSDYTGGVKRVVVIEGVDRNPCCGTHLPSLANLQLFILPQVETSAARSGPTKLYFLCGPRLIEYLSSTHGLLTQTALSLTCGAPQVPERVALVVDERKRADRRVAEVEAELAERLGAELVRGVQPGQRIVRHVQRFEDALNPLAFLGLVATAFIAALEADTQGKDTPYTLVLTSSPVAQTAASMTVVLVVGSDDRDVKQVGESLKAKLDVKGGGKGPRWSGKRTGVWKAGRDDLVVQASLDELQ
ncbi:ThrRS/AlaRS common domain-containing protein [Fistulina hepatica ATCC 64428]|uniref:ThrRS/AlaRS common domain-containing protein n=1 Tax=Fistulina hepatica ATCC 64428 TaxID=1128425 RepID=A0A0D7AJY7_9AGAR|nr:ThrRS/AlaRS common domain-containing protein [Fistulina hepatica ATCC 64428]